VITGENVPDGIIDLLNKAIEKEIESSVQYAWQQMLVDKPEVKDSFRENTFEKLEQAMKIGEILFNLGEIPDALGNIGKSLREMIELDLKAENELIKIYQEILELSTKEKNNATHSVIEKILADELERKRMLTCERGRAVAKITK